MNGTKKFWLATALCVSGVALLFVGLFVGEKGIISSSVIASAGEVFVLAGAILGIDVVYDRKFSETIRQLESDKTKRKESDK